MPKRCLMLEQMSLKVVHWVSQSRKRSMVHFTDAVFKDDSWVSPLLTFLHFILFFKISHFNSLAPQPFPQCLYSFADNFHTLNFFLNSRKVFTLERFYTCSLLRLCLDSKILIDFIIYIHIFRKSFMMVFKFSVNLFFPLFSC